MPHQKEPVSFVFYNDEKTHLKTIVHIRHQGQTLFELIKRAYREHQTDLKGFAVIAVHDDNGHVPDLKHICNHGEHYFFDIAKQFSPEVDCCAAFDEHLRVVLQRKGEGNDVNGTALSAQLNELKQFIQNNNNGQGSPAAALYSHLRSIEGHTGYVATGIQEAKSLISRTFDTVEANAKDSAVGFSKLNVHLDVLAAQVATTLRKVTETEHAVSDIEELRDRIWEANERAKRAEDNLARIMKHLGIE